MSLQILNEAPALALAQVLDLISDNSFSQQSQFQSVSFQREFASLWDLSLVPDKGSLGVVWDQAPLPARFGDANLGPYLNPLIWAVAALLKRSNLDLLILDTDPAQHREGNPLYEIVRALDPDRCPWLRLISIHELGGFLLEHWSSPRSPERTSFDLRLRQSLLGTMADIVRLELTRSTGEINHHAIQNIVGPFVLLGGTYLSNKGANELALLEVFEAVRLLDDRNHRGGEKVIVSKTWPILDWGADGIRLLLVDDQFHHGWADWVQSAIPPDKRTQVRLEATNSPAELISGIERALAASPRSPDARFRLEFETVASGDSPLKVDRKAAETILLLDLRLFALKGTTDEEARFYQVQVVPLCRRFADDGHKRFAWPAFSEEELAQVAAWCAAPDRRKDDEAHTIALTLLPRLLALVDMSLPIVLFSSTGQRAITERLKPYGNIITDFEKPRFLGQNTSDVVTDTRTKFHRAINKALKVISARRFSVACSTEARSVRMPTILRPAKKTDDREQRKPLVDIFVDESGQPFKGTFAVGALLVHYPSASAKQQLTQLLKDNNLVWGIDEERYSPGARFELPRAGEFLPKRYEATSDSKLGLAGLYEQPLSRIAKCCEESGVRITAAGLQTDGDTEWSEAIERTGFPIDRGDALFHSLVRDLLEACLFELFGCYPVEHCPVTVQLATRFAEMGLGERKEILEAMLGTSKFAIQHEKSGATQGLFCSLDTSDVFPMVLGLTRSHPHHQGRFRPVRFRAARLRDFGDVLRKKAESPTEYQRIVSAERNSVPEQLHYLADWVARFARWPWEQIPRTAKRWFEQGFYEAEGAHLQACLQCGRLIDQKAISKAMTRLAEARQGVPAQVPYKASLIRWVMHRLGHSQAKMLGSEFCQAVNFSSHAS